MSPIERTGQPRAVEWYAQHLELRLRLHLLHHLLLLHLLVHLHFLPFAFARYAQQLEELSEELYSESASLYDEFGVQLQDGLREVHRHRHHIPTSHHLLHHLLLHPSARPSLLLHPPAPPPQVNRHLRAHRLLAAGQTLRPVEKMITQACLAPRDGQATLTLALTRTRTLTATLTLTLTLARTYLALALALAASRSGSG